MNSIAIVVFSVLGISFYAALAIALYSWLPRSLGAFGARHGRYAELGVDTRLDGTPPGKMTAIEVRALDAQTA